MTTLTGLLPLDEAEAFAERHRQGIGSTDAAAILGLSPWRTAYDVWAEKVGEAEPVEPSLPMYLGLRLQDTVADLFTFRTGIRVRADRRQHRHRQRSWQVAHLDFRVWGEPTTIVEAKTAYSTDGWGEDGSSEIPIHYWCQVQHQMAVTGATLVHVATLFGHRDFRTFPIPRDDEFVVRLTDAEEEFWTRYIATGEAPPADHSEAARRFLAKRYPRDDGLIIPATPGQAELADQYRASVAVTDAAIKARDTLKNRLIEVIGPNAGLRGGDFEITYRNVKAGDPVTNWRVVAEWATDIIRAIADGCDRDHVLGAIEGSGALADDYQVNDPDDAIRHVIEANTGPGRKAYRRFDFTDRKGRVE
jgi:putative phage-type endonuclease